MRATRWAATLALACFLFTEGVARGGTILSINSVSGPGGTGSGTITNPNPSNDNAAPSPNLLTLTENFTAVDTISAALHVVLDINPATEYFVQVTATNNTGITWTDFHFSWDPAVANDLLDFDSPHIDPPPTGGAFTTLVFAEDALDWSAGSVPSGSTVTFTFSIDIPNTYPGPGAIALNARPTVAEVPEPASLTLFFFVGLIGAAGHTVRRNRRK
jgi:hypothetical protein